MRITLPHTPIPSLTFLYALVQSTPKGDFAKVGHGAHADHAHKQDQQSNGVPHPNEIR